MRRTFIVGVAAVGLASLAVPGPWAAASGHRASAPVRTAAHSATLRIGPWTIPDVAPAAHVHAAGAVAVPAVKVDNPRHLLVGPDGALYIASAGRGGPSGGANCVPSVSEQGKPTSDCLGATGAIDRLGQDLSFGPVVSGLPSVITEPTAGSPAEVSGPAGVSYVGGRVQVAVQATDLKPNGTNAFGTAGADLGTVLSAVPGGGCSTGVACPPSSTTVIANLAAYAAANPQPASSLGTAPGESATDSDPYAVTPYRGGFAVVDAAANALRWISPTGVVSTLATFPFKPGQTYPPGIPAPAQDAQAVPTSVAVGPDGALYVSELVGVPSDPGTSDVFRVVPGQAPTVYASGFSAATDVAFNQAGQLLVLEYNAGGLLSRTPNNGALIAVTASGQHITLLSGLNDPTGMAVDDGVLFVSNNGDSLSTDQTPGEVLIVPALAPYGYRMTASDGGVFNFGLLGFYGSTGNVVLNKPVVGAADDPIAPGYWSVASDGGIFGFGDAGFYGSLGNIKLNAPIVGMAPTPDGRGYWLVASDGGIFDFGDAAFYGSLGNIKLNKPIVGIAASPDGGGYTLVASDGGIFNFGDAGFYGSLGNVKLNQPIVGIAASPSGLGYWLVASDGGIFDFGDAQYFGSLGNVRLNKPIVGIAAAPDGLGYWLAGSDGGVFGFGDAGFDGSLGNVTLSRPVIAVAS